MPQIGRTASVMGKAEGTTGNKTFNGKELGESKNSKKAMNFEHHECREGFEVKPDSEQSEHPSQDSGFHLTSSH